MAPSRKGMGLRAEVRSVRTYHALTREEHQFTQDGALVDVTLLGTRRQVFRVLDPGVMKTRKFNRQNTVGKR